MRRKVTAIIESWHDSCPDKVLMIRGSRQVGKTYSVREFGRRVYGDRFLEINFKDNPNVSRVFKDDLRVDSVIKKLSFEYRDFEFVPGETLIFLDEIQECPDARTALKPFADDGRYRVIASGSLPGIGMGEVGLHPTGYLRRVDMHPMDFEEFLWAMDMPQGAIDEVRESISRLEPVDDLLFDTFTRLHSEYMVVGGMPEAVLTYTDTRTVTGLRAVFDELHDGYCDDIAKYADRHIGQIARSCLDSIPVMLSAENKRFVYSRVGSDPAQRDGGGAIPEGSRGTGFRYFAPALEWLSMAGISLTCQRVTEPVSPLEERRDIGDVKLYMLDTGLLISRYDDAVFREVVFGNPDVNSGAIAENAVAQAFAAQGRRLMYLRMAQSRTEVDFLTVVDGKVCCIEVKSGSNRRCRSLNRVMEGFGTMGIMFETRNVFVDDKGVRHYPLFAASFMDAIDPRRDVEFDHSFMDEVIRMYGGR